MLDRETTALNESRPIVPFTRDALPVDTIELVRQPVRQRAQAVACAGGRGLSDAPVAAAAMDAARPSAAEIERNRERYLAAHPDEQQTTAGRPGGSTGD